MCKRKSALCAIVRCVFRLLQSACCVELVNLLEYKA